MVHFFIFALYFSTFSIFWPYRNPCAWKSNHSVVIKQIVFDFSFVNGVMISLFSILWHEKTWAFHQLFNWEHKNYRVSCLTCTSDMFRFSLSADYRKLWSQLWTVKATVCSLGHIGICEYPQRREQSLVNEFVFTVITMFFFHFSFSGIRNDSSNDLLMAWEQTASGHPCIVFSTESLRQ